MRKIVDATDVLRANADPDAAQWTSALGQRPADGSVEERIVGVKYTQQSEESDKKKKVFFIFFFIFFFFLIFF